MRRYPSTYGSSFSFGPGPLPPVIKWLIVSNVAVFLGALVTPSLIFGTLGLVPREVLRHFSLWRLATYMFVHYGFFHIFFNMFALWMFGTELERVWGPRFFLKFYFVTGIGAGILTVAFSMLPFSFANQVYASNVVGASGAVYGLLLAWALYFPNRPVYMYLLFPVPARVFVALMGAIALLSSLSSSGGVANATHLGGLAIAYLYLKNAHQHVRPIAELKYRYLKWRINRVRKNFDVYAGGRSDDWDRRIH
jgi:membrane associated rhomboid family serine protease